MTNQLITGTATIGRGVAVHSIRYEAIQNGIAIRHINGAAYSVETECGQRAGRLYRADVESNRAVTCRKCAAKRAKREGVNA